MSNRSKLEKFAENLKFNNVFENYDYKSPQLYVGHQQPVNYKGKWKSEYFNNNYPLILELACGRGEYSLGLARMYPEVNVIGVDIKGARIWQGASNSIQEKINRIAFIRTKIELLEHFFETEEVDEIWITFPDPHPNPTDSIKRLVSNYFLDIYSKIIVKNAQLHLKTDEPNYYEFGLKTIGARSDFEIIYSNNDIYNQSLYSPSLEIKTYYERMHLEKSRTIKYIHFKYSTK
ncbi:MAG: tRNA (guanosine(46)-N7)-methyltransferase TrmB [Saprospiraceae bacterium]